MPTKIPNEIELKLRISTKDVLRLRRHVAIKKHLAGKPVTRRLISIYYDTPDLQLLKKRISLRVRRMSGRWFQAVKGSGHSLAGLHQRMEWEDIIARGYPDFTKITETSLARIFAEQSLRGALRPIFITDVKRTEWQLVYEDGTAIEVALDLGQLEIDDQSEPISELELELKNGEACRLFELAAELQKTIPLHIENISKAERGYRHLYSPTASASRAEAIDLPAKACPVEAFQAAGLECLRQMQANQDLAMSGDIEATHQMHIAVRRLKVAFKLFKFGKHSIRAEVDWLNRLIGNARNWDVLITETLPQLPNQKASLNQLQPAIARRHGASYRTLKKAIQSQRYQAMLLQLGATLTKPTKKHGQPAGKMLCQKLQTIYDRLPWDKTELNVLSKAQLHRTRIRIKRLRYGQAFFKSPEYRKLPTGDITRLQKDLGLINDLHVGKRLLINVARTLPAALRQQINEEISAAISGLAALTEKSMQSNWETLRHKKTRKN